MIAAAAFGATSASALDLAPPPGWVLDVASVTPTTTAGYVQFSTTFTATQPQSYISFLFRRDPSYFGFDDASLVANGSATNLLADPGFESGPVGSQAPIGWGNFQQTGGIAATGDVETGTGRGGEVAHSGANFWDDGSVGAYDGIFQQVPTTVGQQYTLSFWLSNPDTGAHYSQTGNGIDVLAYAGDLPAGIVVINPPPGVPEPAAWALLMSGLGFAGLAVRRRRVAASYA